MRRRLIGQQIRKDAPSEQPVEQVHRVCLDADRKRHLLVPGVDGSIDRSVEGILPDVQISGLQAPLDPFGLHLRDERGRSTHGRGQRLSCPHPSETGRNDEPALEPLAEVLLRRCEKRLEGPLHDALAADVDP